MGERVAHSFSVRNVVDYLDVAPDFGIVTVQPPASFVGRTFRELDLANRLRLTPIALRRGDDVTINPHHDDAVRKGDVLILIGSDDRLEALGD
jgi:trk system potassium uptake protein TrkA